MAEGFEHEKRPRCGISEGRGRLRNLR
jgi:hypothetical protein